MPPRPQRRSLAVYILCFICICTGLLLPRAASADDLLQVYNAAREHDADLQSARALLRSAQPRAAQADALLRPSVNATGSSTRATINQSSSGSDLADGGGSARTTTSSLNLTLRQPLFNLAASTDVAKAKNALEVARTEFEITEQEFIVRVAQAYFDVLSAQDILAATRSSKVSLAGQLASATRNYGVGTAIITDVRDSQARYDLVLAQEVSAENDLRVRQLLLDRLVGRRNVAPNPLAVPVVLPPIVPGDASAWVDAATVHPGIRRARLALQAAELDSRRAKSAHLPTIDAVGAVGRNRVAASGSVAPGTFVAGTTRNSSVGIELNLPLFAGYSTQNRIRETLSLEDKAQFDLQATRNSVADAVQRAYFDLQSGQSQVRALEVAEASGTLSLEGTQLGYRAGVRLNLDVLNAQVLVFQTRRDLAKARYDVLMGSLKLRLASGQLSPDDVSAMNRLLAR